MIDTSPIFPLLLVTVEGFGTYRLCETHAQALKNDEPYEKLRQTVASYVEATGDPCDACPRRGLDNAYVMVRKREREKPRAHVG